MNPLIHRRVVAKSLLLIHVGRDADDFCFCPEHINAAERTFDEADDTFCGLPKEKRFPSEVPHLDGLSRTFLLNGLRCEREGKLSPEDH